jgi:purine-binding chemotaxis protein CheW
MTSRKKPQQQLACYFNELLTELDDDIAKPIAEYIVEPIAETTKELMTSSESRVSTVAPVASTTPPSVSADRALTQTTPKLASQSTSDTASTFRPTSALAKLLSDSGEANDDKTISTPIAPHTLASHSTDISSRDSCHDTGLMPKPAENNLSASLSSHPLADVDLRQREKDKLERLLKTLTPRVESQFIQPTPEVGVKTQPIETAQPTKTADTLIVKAKKVVAPAIPEINVDEDSLLNQTVKTEVKTDIAVEGDTVGLAVPIEMSSSPHRWQPLGHEWQESGRPTWAENSFDVLLVEVNGVKLAMPLESLDAIYPLKDELTPLFGQAKWFMGIQKTITGNISIINTAQFLMPERYNKEQASETKYSVAINGSGWGLAVDKIHQPVPVSPEGIRWRVRRAERPWMAGTVKDHMCALLDIPYLAHSLKTQDKNRQTPNK